MRNSNVVVSHRLSVFGPKGNLSLCSGHEELGGGPVFDLFLSALLCFAHLMFELRNERFLGPPM